MTHDTASRSFENVMRILRIGEEVDSLYDIHEKCAKQYRKLCLRFYPDKFTHPEANFVTQLINLAWKLVESEEVAFALFYYGAKGAGCIQGMPEASDEDLERAAWLIEDLLNQDEQQQQQQQRQQQQQQQDPPEPAAAEEATESPTATLLEHRNRRGQLKFKLTWSDTPKLGAVWVAAPDLLERDPGSC